MIKLTEYLKKLIDIEHTINEMAKVNSITDKTLPYNKYEVNVQDETVKAKKNIPHFHFVIKDKNIMIKVKIDNINKLNILGIKGNKTGIKKDLSNIWSVYSKEYKLLSKWLNETNIRNSKLTNSEAIEFMWNAMNS